MWKRGLNIALITAAFGAWLVDEQGKNPIIRDADTAFQEWLAAHSPMRTFPSVQVTIVEMEDAANWTALDYVLFLRAFPARTEAAVVLESLPVADDTAYYRSFVNIALKQPRLILPVQLSRKPVPSQDMSWWNGLPVKGAFRKEPLFSSIEFAPGEELRSIIPVGAWDSSPPKTRAAPAMPFYYRLGDRAVPSLALEAMLLAWHVPEAEVSISPGVAVDVSGAKRLVDAQGNLLVDATLLPGLPHFRSSDLLLKLDAPQTGSQLGTPIANLEKGVILLGDVSESARIYRDAQGRAFSRVELLGAAISTLNQTPPPGRLSFAGNVLLVGLGALFAFLCALQRDDLRLTLLLLVAALFFWAAFQVIQNLLLALPLFLPVALLLFGFALAELAARLFPIQSHGKSQP